MTPQDASLAAAKVCGLAPVVPVLVVDDASLAQDLAAALVKGGLPALEVTLRTPAALDVIREMAKVDGGVVGAGTLLTPKDVEEAKAAGATFGVSPGATDLVLDACEACACLSAAIRSRSSFQPKPTAVPKRSKLSVRRSRR